LFQFFPVLLQLHFTRADNVGGPKAKLRWLRFIGKGSNKRTNIPEFCMLQQFDNY